MIRNFLKKLTVFTVIGARPQFIKAATVSRALAEIGDVEEVIVHTGQHFDANMSDIFFTEMAIPRPTHQLGISGGHHGAMTGRMLEELESLMHDLQPDLVMVYGDTNSTLAGALAASKMHIPLAHVEAGLRSFNKRMPEEVNRVVSDHISDLLLAPTQTAVNNLVREGISAGQVHLVGDVMYDTVLFYREFAYPPEWFDELGTASGSFILATIHRAENTDDERRLRGIIEGLSRAEQPVVLPLHPRTRQRFDALELSLGSNIHVVDPVGYLEMVWLEANCAVVATDSGGVQKEAFFHGKPCVILRSETEWVELVDIGVAVLAGTDADSIARALGDSDQLAVSKAQRKEIFGTGDASFKIAEILSGHQQDG